MQQPSAPDYDRLTRNQDRYRATAESSSSGTYSPPPPAYAPSTGYAPPPPFGGYGGMADALRGRNVYRGNSGGERVSQGVSLRRSMGSAPRSVSLSQLAIQPNVEPVDRPSSGQGGGPGAGRTGTDQYYSRRGYNQSAAGAGAGGGGGSYEPPPFERVSQSDFRQPYVERGQEPQQGQGRQGPPQAAGRPSDFGASRAAEIGRRYGPRTPPQGQQQYGPPRGPPPQGQDRYYGPPPGQQYPPQGYQGQPTAAMGPNQTRQSSGGQSSFDPSRPYYQDRHGLRSLADRPDRQPHGDGDGGPDSKSFRPFPFQRLSQADFRQPYQGDAPAVGGRGPDGAAAGGGGPPGGRRGYDGPPYDDEFDRMMAGVPPGGVPPIFFAPPPGGPPGGPPFDGPGGGPTPGGLPRNPGDKVPRDPFEERRVRREASRERRPREPDAGDQERRPREPSVERRPREPTMNRQERRPTEPNQERRPREPTVGRQERRPNEPNQERRPREPNFNRQGQERTPNEPNREERRPREPSLGRQERSGPSDGTYSMSFERSNGERRPAEPTNRQERRPNEPGFGRQEKSGPSRDGTYSMSFERSNGERRPAEPTGRREGRPNEPTYRTRSTGSASSRGDAAGDRRDDDVPMSRVERRVGRNDGGGPPPGTTGRPDSVEGRAGDDMSYEEYKSYFDGSRR